jgi:hypothetical protein
MSIAESFQRHKEERTFFVEATLFERFEFVLMISSKVLSEHRDLT